MNIDNYGNVVLDEKEIFNFLYSGVINDISKIYSDHNTTEKFNSSKLANQDRFSELKSYTISDQNLQEFDENNQNQWFFPKNYCSNLIESIYSLCKTEEEKNRVTLELELFMKHNMLNLLFYLKYLVDTMTSNNIVWGVGRGSSVASYVLFLIGVHKIDSLKYNLDIHEFLK